MDRTWYIYVSSRFLRHEAGATVRLTDDEAKADSHSRWRSQERKLHLRMAWDPVGSHKVHPEGLVGGEQQGPGKSLDGGHPLRMNALTRGAGGRVFHIPATSEFFPPCEKKRPFLYNRLSKRHEVLGRCFSPSSSSL